MWYCPLQTIDKEKQSLEARVVDLEYQLAAAHVAAKSAARGPEDDAGEQQRRLSELQEHVDALEQQLATAAEPQGQDASAGAGTAPSEEEQQQQGLQQQAEIAALQSQVNTLEQQLSLSAAELEHQAEQEAHPEVAALHASTARLQQQLAETAEGSDRFQSQLSDAVSRRYAPVVQTTTSAQNLHCEGICAISFDSSGVSLVTRIPAGE